MLWPVQIGGRSFMWIKEEAWGVGYVVFYNLVQGLYYIAEAFVHRDPCPHAAEVEPVHGHIVWVGYPCGGDRVVLLVVEETENCHFQLLYVEECGSWLIAQEFQAQLSDVDDFRICLFLMFCKMWYLYWNSVPRGSVSLEYLHAGVCT